MPYMWPGLIPGLKGTKNDTWSKGGTKRRQVKDPNKLADDFLAGLDLFSAADVAQVVRSRGF